MFPDFSQLDKLGKDLTGFMDIVKVDLKTIKENQYAIQVRINDLEKQITNISYKEVNHV